MFVCALWLKIACTEQLIKLTILSEADENIFGKILRKARAGPVVLAQSLGNGCRMNCFIQLLVESDYLFAS